MSKFLIFTLLPFGIRTLRRIRSFRTLCLNCIFLHFLCELKKEADDLTELFRKVLGKEKLEVKVEKLKDVKVSAMVTLSEESRRMQDMMKMYNAYGMDPSMFASQETLVLNANNSLVQYVFTHKEGDYRIDTLLLKHAHILALLLLVGHIVYNILFRLFFGSIRTITACTFRLT